MDVEITRSTRRRKTLSARVVDGVIRVAVPAGMPAADEQRLVAKLVARVERAHRATEVDLDARATHLAAKYDLPAPTSVRWVSNQQSRWGSCTPVDGSIRLSDRMTGYPQWVVDYVLVHELAHLAHADHGPRFKELVSRYPLAERAIGFLLAKGLDPDDG